MNPKNIKTVIIPLSFNHPLKDDCPGTYKRFLTGIYQEVRRFSVVMQTAGYSKKTPRRFDGYCYRSLSEALLKKLQGENNPWKDNFVARPLGWGTRDQIRFAFKLIRQLKIASSHESLCIVISSNRLHLWRIKWYVMMYKPKAWQVIYKVADHPFPWRDKLLEIPKHGQAFLQAIPRLKVMYRFWIKKNSHRLAFSLKAVHGTCYVVNRLIS